MQTFDPAAYGPRIEALLRVPAPQGLSHGSPIAAAEQPLTDLAAMPPFDGTAADESMAKACLAGLWLRFDFAEKGHALAQSLSGGTGAYWHGIHHRREPDYPNAKYWFRRAGDHPVHGDLLAAAKAAAKVAVNAGAAASAVSVWPAWDAFGFVDLCQQHAGSSTSDEDFCLAVQAREWELLFDYGYRRATSR